MFLSIGYFEDNTNCQGELAFLPAGKTRFQRGKLGTYNAALPSPLSITDIGHIAIGCGTLRTWRKCCISWKTEIFNAQSDLEGHEIASREILRDRMLQSKTQ
ncbi:hypothetical protein OCU04_000104 [Sclerotinia nivalis]|uniref:Uncharacterized protein n=1 Tax=Sclerotinia nivalis TaxID=352851 RepID=A0A9X0DN23_9HELO|nr:hypothetical protein OCU04_000104 [Sclerotinia nivalis]